MRTSRYHLALGMFLAICGVGMAGPSWVEPPCPGGTGGTGGTAQGTTGSGPLGSIGGNLCGGSSLGRSSAVAGTESDYEDVYRIRICNAQMFSARTVANFNAQLWLFTDEGAGLLGNDDQNEQTMEARIASPANDGSAQMIPGPGVYLIAISGHNNDPRSAGDDIFYQDSNIERSGPDGPGGLGTLDGWSGEGETGEYVILLEGTALLGDDCTDPRYVGGGIPAVSEWGLAILALTVLSGGTIMLGRR